MKMRSMAPGPCAALALLLTIQPLSAQAPSALPDAARAAERFAVATFPALADSFDVPGAVIAVVHADSTLALEGFGYADLEMGTPVDPTRTLFRVASLSKLVTATAVMRLWERGRIDLQSDVNSLLRRVRVPEAFGRPVTAHDLLTHTAGFDERIFGVGARDAAPDLESFIAETLPPRVTPPGQLHLYSNHGYGLLGVLASDISGRPFVEVASREVFEPLGMRSSTFAQPPPPELADDLATGYTHVNGGYAPLPFDYVAFGPAGSLTTTAADMARFMTLHVAGPTPGGGPILADSTRRIMQGARWRTHPAMRGMGYGFFRTGLGRYGALRHRGGWPGWVAQLILVPDLDLGLFVAVNTDDNGLVDALLKQFATDVLGGPEVRPAVKSPGFVARAGGLVGSYRLARHDHGTFGKVAALLGMPAPDFRVSIEGDSALLVVSGEVVRRTYEVEPLVFVEPGLDPQWFHFETDAEGRAVRLHATTASLERIAWWETAGLHHVALTVGMIVLISAVGAWFVARFRRREIPPMLRRARGLVAASSGCFLLFGAGVVAAFMALGVQGIFQPFPPWFRALFLFPLLGVVLGLLAVPHVAIVWKDGLGSLAGRIHLVCAASAIMMLIPVLAYWNVLGLP